MHPFSSSNAIRCRIVEWALVGLLGTNLIWTTLCLGGYRPETMLVTSLLTAFTLAVYLIGRVWSGATTGAHWTGWLFLPFLIYAAINVHWVAPVRWLGWHDWLFWAHFVAVFWVVLNGVRSRGAQKTLLGVVALLVLAATVLAAYQRFVQPAWLMLGREQSDQFLSRSSGPFGIPNSLAAFYLLVLPALLVLTLRRGASAVQRVLFGYLVICALAGLFFTVSRGGWLGLGLSLCAWPLFVGSWAWWRRLVAVGVAGLLAASLVWGVYQFSPTARGRINDSIRESGEWTRPVMWRGAWQLFQTAPWVGTGGGSYNVLFEKYRPEKYQMEPQWAHNDYLNTLSDYGIVGFGLFFGMAGIVVVAGIFGSVSKFTKQAGHDVWDEPLFWQALGIGLLAFALQLFVDFHFKIPALGMMCALLAAVLVRWRWPTGDWGWGGSARWLSGMAAIGVVCGAAWAIYPHYRAEALRYSTRQALDKLWQLEPADAAYRDTVELARLRLARACEIDPTNAQAWADRALATALWSHVEAGGSAVLGAEAERYARQALALAPVVAEFWIRQSVALDMQGQWMQGGEAMIKALQLAPAHSMVWFYYGYHLSLQSAASDQARAAFDYCLRLDPANATAQRLRHKLATGQ